MGFQNHHGTYVKILTGEYAGQYGEAGISSSDTDLVQVYPVNVKTKTGARIPLVLDIFMDIEVVKCPAQIQALKALYSTKVDKNAKK